MKMKKNSIEWILYSCGLILIVIGLIIDILRGKPFSIGYAQMLLVMFGAGIIVCGILLRMNRLSIILKFINGFYLKTMEKVKNCRLFEGKNHWILLIFLLITATIFFWPKPIHHDRPDEAYYLSLAKNLFFKNGYVYPDLSPVFYRGPIFPFVISLSYSLFGFNFFSVTLMMQIIWISTIIAVYLLAYNLFNARIAFFSAVFFLTSKVIFNEFNYFLSDVLLTFLLISIVLLIWYSFKTKKILFYFLSGLFLGVAYLTKQTAIILIPLPFLFWVSFKEYRNRKIFKSLLFFLVPFLLLFFGWIGYKFFFGGTAGQITRDFDIGSDLLSYFVNTLSKFSNKSVEPTNTIATTQTISLTQVFSIFYKRDINNYFRFAPLFPIAILYTLFQSIKNKSKPDTLITYSLLLFSSLIPSGVVINYGPRHNLFFYIITLICLVSFIDRLFITLFKNRSVVPLIIFFTSLCTFQLMEHKPSISVFSSDQNNVKIFNGAKKVSTWINENIPQEENIITIGRSSNILHVLIKDNKPIYSINLCEGERTYGTLRKCEPPYLFFWTNRGRTDPNDARARLMGISEDSFIETINDKQIKVLIVPPDYLFFKTYLDMHKDFHMINSIDGHAIYSVDGIVHEFNYYSDTPWNTCLGKGTTEFLRKLTEEYPSKYQKLFRTQIFPWMGLSDDEIREYIHWQGCTFSVK